MTVYLNKISRPDILVETGGSLDENEAHVTSSALRIYMPADSKDIAACDYIQLVENDNVIFAGTVMEAEQENLDNVDLSYKIYNLTLTNNSDYIASVFVDMTFPPGASVTQILMGNRQGQSWYDASLGEFYGIIPVRVENEGITVGKIDDFTGITLNSPAYLWGQIVSSVIDQMADVCGAWWEITPDKVFNMRYTYNRNTAPISLDSDSAVYNVNITRDSFTMYSAVRVVGGQSKGQYQEFQIKSNGETGLRFERISPQIIRCKYPLYSMSNAIQSGVTSSTVPANVKIGFNGIDDDDDTVQALMSYGEYEIEMKDGYEWLDLSNGGYIQVNGYPLIQVYSRLVDGNLREKIKAQRGGSGIIEYLIEDETIVDFSDAALNAETFLQRAAQPAFTISFSTLIPGWSAGQLLTVDLPYFNTFGNFQVTSVSAKSILSKDNGTMWEYSVEASTISYRDKTKTLFFQPKKITFEMDGSLPAADGQYINDDINIQTYIMAFKTQPTDWRTLEGIAPSWTVWEEIFPSWLVFEKAANVNTWSEIESTIKNWRGWEKAYPSWFVFEELIKGWYYLGNYLTPFAKQKLLKLIQGQGAAGDLSGINLVSDLYFTTNASNDFHLPPADIVEVSATSVTATYYLLPDQLQEKISGLQMYYNGSQQNEPILQAAVNIDRSPDNPEGEFAMTLSVRHAII